MDTKFSSPTPHITSMAQTETSEPLPMVLKKKELKELAAEHTDSALKVLTDIMGDEKAGSMTRVQAAIAVLDRGHGKPAQVVQSEIKIKSLAEEMDAVRKREERFQRVVARDVQVIEATVVEPEPDWGAL